MRRLVRRRHQGRPSRDIVGHRARGALQPRPSRRVGCRGQHRRRRRHPHPGPRPLPARRRRLRPAPGGRLRRRPGFLPAEPRRREGDGADRAGSSPKRACRVVGWRDVPDRPDHRRADRPQRHAELPAGVRRRPGRHHRHRPRSQAVRGPQALRARDHERPPGLPVVYFPSLSSRTLVYKGMLTTPQLAEFFPDLSDERVRVGAGAGAQPLLDQHVPVVAARAPVPLHRPQRRDQHRCRATATGCARAKR